MPPPLAGRHREVVLRHPGQVQLGHYPGSGLVLDGLSDREARWLQHLGSSRGAAGAPAEADRRDLLLALVEVADGLQRRTPSARPGTDRRARSQATRRVLVCGDGPVADAIAAVLEAGGARVSAGGGPEAADALPDLVVLASRRPPPWSAGEQWRRLWVPLLPVVAGGGRVCVGPVLVRGGACLGCLHLHRTDRDDGWPVIARQLVTTAPVGGEPVHASATVTALAAALTGAVAGAVLDGDPVPVDLSIEGGDGWPSLDYRRWPPHPECPCREDMAALDESAP